VVRSVGEISADDSPDELDVFSSGEGSDGADVLHSAKPKVPAELIVMKRTPGAGLPARGQSQGRRAI
jgi:hypothetical protein